MGYTLIGDLVHNFHIEDAVFETVVSAGAACLTAGIWLLSRIDATTAYTQLVPGMVVLGIGIGLFYSSITTAAITAVDPSRASLAGAIVYMCQVAGGSVGLGLNTALVATAPSLTAGIHRAFQVDAGLAFCGLVVSALYVGGRIGPGQWHTLVHRHRAHG
jgi:dipeptide/tripeptide permease